MRDGIDALAQRMLNREYVFKTAATQGIAALVLRTLEAVAPTAVPATIR